MNAKEIIKQITEIDKGIIPFCVWYNKPNGINQDRWTSMTVEEKIMLKRKFRKLFRKACRKFGINPKQIKGPGNKASLVRRYIEEFCEENKF